MCMGLGCNAAGVVGCRIIDSERERLLAVLTNSLMPCNGRFPALIALMTMFFFAQRQHARRRAAAHGGARAVRGADVRRNVAAERDRAARQAVGLRTGAAAVPRAAGRSSARALRFRPDAVRAQARRRRGSAGRHGAVDAGKRAPRRCEPADAVRGCARPVRAGNGYGRRAAAGVRARLSGQRDRAADRRDGLSGAGQSGRRAGAGADARTADRKRLDVDDRRERRAVFSCCTGRARQRSGRSGARPAAQNGRCWRRCCRQRWAWRCARRSRRWRG